MRHRVVELLAPAKVNLTLHVVGRREDGYHLLDSLVVFTDVGDRITLAPAPHLSLDVTGPFADAVPGVDANLAAKAARLAGESVAIKLHKALPAGAGIGGGSSDAAAVLRGVSSLTGRPTPDALSLGADVPVCFAARPARMRGVGETLQPLPPLPELPMVLLYPGVGASTPAVFSRLADPDLAPMPTKIPAWATIAEAAVWLAGQRNDLEEPALRVVPEIAEARAALAPQRACLLARMTGSGSTVFGLFASHEEAEGAARNLAERYPGWWVQATRTLSEAPAVQESRVTT